MDKVELIQAAFHIFRHIVCLRETKQLCLSMLRKDHAIIAALYPDGYLFMVYLL